MKPRRVVGPWNLTDLSKVEKNGLRVFSCFCCGGGSTMGYKLAGFDVLGGVEIDPVMAKVYSNNHGPKNQFVESVVDFSRRTDFPEGLVGVDVLDGSPPCSSFSISGNREKDWGKEKKFREGQACQVLDDLFFAFLDVAQVLKPKVVIAENVKGMVSGKARGYVRMVLRRFKELGYTCQLLLLNARSMGVPQSRERVFFVASRVGGSVKVDASEPDISVGAAVDSTEAAIGRPLTTAAKSIWGRAIPGLKTSTNSNFSRIRVNRNLPAPTTLGHSDDSHWSSPHYLSPHFYSRVQSFPDDFDFSGSKAEYVCGMSVPPFMMQRIALAVGEQILGAKYDTGEPVRMGDVE